jgi:hypothetical protein
MPSLVTSPNKTSHELPTKPAYLTPHDVETSVKLACANESAATKATAIATIVAAVQVVEFLMASIILGVMPPPEIPFHVCRILGTKSPPCAAICNYGRKPIIGETLIRRVQCYWGTNRYGERQARNAHDAERTSSPCWCEEIVHRCDPPFYDKWCITSGTECRPVEAKNVRTMLAGDCPRGWGFLRKLDQTGREVKHNVVSQWVFLSTHSG